MSGYLYDCSCNGGIIFGVSQCRACGDTSCLTCDPSGSYNIITQKRIWNTVRVPESEYIMNLSSLNVYQPALPEYANVNWNQYSDRPTPANSHPNLKITIVPSRGNSTKSSITRLRPGSLKPGGTGVDIKHGSYHRYLARLKGKGPLRTQRTTVVVPLKGNKTKAYGISNKAGACLCFNK